MRVFEVQGWMLVFDRALCNLEVVLDGSLSIHKPFVLALSCNGDSPAIRVRLARQENSKLFPTLVQNPQHASNCE